MIAIALASGISALLLFAAWRDIATRLIPDTVSLAIAALALGLRGVAGLGPTLTSVGIAAALFLLLLLLAMRGILGGGDVKLAAAVALALPPGAAWGFLQATVFCGGALGLAYMAAPRLLPEPTPAASSAAGPQAAPLRRIARAEARRLRRGGPLPYAVAIAAGGILTLFALEG